MKKELSILSKAPFYFIRRYFTKPNIFDLRQDTSDRPI